MESPASAAPSMPRIRWPYQFLGALLGIPESRRVELPLALKAGTRRRWVVFMIFARVWNLAAKTLGRRTAWRSDVPVEPVKSPVAHLAFEDLKVQSRSAAGVTAPSTAACSSGVPKILFQTWKSRHRLPADFAAWSSTLRAAHPGWQYVRWDDADNRRFIECHHAWFLPTYDAYPREILRADAVRYFFLYQFGGLYADMDTECLRPLDNTFDDGADVWLGRMGSAPDFAHSIPNAMMAARPRQEFWLLVMFLMARNAREAPVKGGDGVEAMTGPIVLKQAHDLYVSAADRAFVESAIRDIARHYGGHLPSSPARSRVRLLAAHAWYPIDWSNVIHCHMQAELRRCELGRRAAVRRWLFPGSTLVTYWSHSWGQ